MAYGVHCLGEEEVGEGEVSVQDTVGVQIEEALHYLSEHPTNCEGSRVGEERR